MEAVLPSHAARAWSEESKGFAIGFAMAKPAMEAANTKEDNIVKKRETRKKSERETGTIRRENEGNNQPQGVRVVAEERR